MTTTRLPGLNIGAATCAGAPATSSTASATFSSISAGSFAQSPALEQHGFAANPNASGRDVDAVIASMCSGVSVSETSDAMRSPACDVDLAAQRFADFEHAADEHAAAAGDGIVLFAALSTLCQ